MGEGSAASFSGGAPCGCSGNLRCPEGAQRPCSGSVHQDPGLFQGVVQTQLPHGHLTLVLLC